MYRVFGYDDMCVRFSQNFDSFVQAVKAYNDCIYFAVAFIQRTDTPNTSCLFVSLKSLRRRSTIL